MSRRKIRYKPELFLNRELSWLEFNRRVLSEALDSRNPLLERIKFLSIFSTNLDEFFMKRVGGLKRQIGAGVTRETIDGLTPREQLDKIQPLVHEMVQNQRNCLLNDVFPALQSHGIVISSYEELTKKQKNTVDAYFKRSVFPILTPLGYGPGQPFPFISNLSLSLGVLVKKPKCDAPVFARLKIPQNRPRWVNVGEANHFVPLEQVIAANLRYLFPGVEVLFSCAFRVTRNADIDRNEEEAEDLLELIEEELRHRRFASVVRLEINSSVTLPLLHWLIDELRIKEEDVYKVEGPLNLKDLMQLTKLNFPQLKDKPWKPIIPPTLRATDEDGRPVSFFQLLSKGDVLVHHPYESFGGSVQRFLQEASIDPSVLAIKQTLYRTADDSPIIRALVKASENGKQVAVLVEIKARFDEANNIQWVRTLERAGVHVTYGFAGLKTHTKTLLIVREEPDGIKRYFHIGTGNYHSGTANLYTDLGMLSCRRDLGEDLTDLFNFLTGHSDQKKYRKLLVAPVNMRQKFLRLIRREINNVKKGGQGRIIAKMNQLEDPEIITQLYEASKVGVQIDLIVRGFCCLRPGLPHTSENIRIISIIGRFLEHSRIFYFYNNGKEDFYIGSADWMSRNLDYRVEAVTPIENTALREELKTSLEIMLSDNRKAWEQQSDGSYIQRIPKDSKDERCSHELLMQRALNR
ncbi:MAG: polyphosphate kinase 1 [Candidatus Omnitrophica bacterium]|nr:polyphosphate kinase 1 [Candidatus Omnitrophota bacterium]